jgi:hypothetical protein
MFQGSLSLLLASAPESALGPGAQTAPLAWLLGLERDGCPPHRVRDVLGAADNTGMEAQPDSEGLQRAQIHGRWDQTS